ncbi:MAG TPA: enoyl-ACP reductase FabV [Polyangia bacterium]|jgi:enoyl-[acyl-carrier protein] reductase/trans-2-enoyl-CoA reductase (NAD+)
MSTPQVIAARIRGFICLNAHPVGCAANVERQIAVAKAGGPGRGIVDALVLGASTGYGLSSLLTTTFGYGARSVGVCLERAPQGDKTASAGWYNLAAARRFAKAGGRVVEMVNGDAYSNEIKAETIATLKRLGMKLNTVVYSLASPRRTDPISGQTFTSVLKPVGQPFSSRSINLGNDQLVNVDIAPATDADVEATVKVMGGEDWALWIRALLAEGLLAEGCRTVAYSYLGPALTYPIYRSGTIGKAKEHLETTAAALGAELRAALGGQALVSVNKALVTQASSAIPVVPLYISILYKVMKAKGTHEGTIEQIVRMFRDHLGPQATPSLDEAGRIRLDDWELAPDVQAAVDRAWNEVTTETLFATTDYAGFKREFRELFGFEVPGIDYTQPVDVSVD